MNAASLREGVYEPDARTNYVLDEPAIEEPVKGWTGTERQRRRRSPRLLLTARTFRKRSASLVSNKDRSACSRYSALSITSDTLIESPWLP